MLKELKLGRVVVFVDSANIFYSEKALGWKISYEKLKKYFDGECISSKVFFYAAIDEANIDQQRFIGKVRSAGLTVITKPVKRIRGSSGSVRLKGNVDVELSMDILDKRDEYDTAVLMSGDSDFAPVVDKIKSLGKRIIIMSTNDRVSKELLDRGKYINIKKLRDVIELTDNP
ncbi:NYN domain-containing protein [Patescibacteria group bacterium]|nr:MAG: NYN domain-containing protein [Patescibacteria group bacterium]